MTQVLLPLKDLVKAKSRLSGLLSPSERRALAQAKSEFPEIVKTYGGPHSAKKVTADGRRYTAGNSA